jgi:DHA1 family tetracycline resistance protein-like MFS transporter
MHHKKALGVLFATLLLDMIGIGMVFPIIPIIFTDPTSHSFLLSGYPEQYRYIFAGLITALFGLMQFFSAPILGELSDAYGRRKLLLMGVGVLAFSQALFGFGIELVSLPLVLFSRVIAGIAGGNFSIAQAVIADVSTPQDRAKNFGLIGAAFGLGFIIGPVLSGWIASYTGSAAAPFWFASMLGLLNVLSVAFFLPETRTHVREHSGSFSLLKGIRDIQHALTDRLLRPYYGINFLYYTGFAFFTSTIGLMLVSRFSYDEGAIGIFFGVVGIWVVITQGFLLRLISRRFHERTLLSYTIPLVGLSLLGFAFVPAAHLLFAVIPFMAIPQGISMANLTAILSKHVSADNQGKVLGINGSLSAFSQGAVPLIAGLLAASIGITGTLALGSLFFFASWYLLVNKA